MNIQFDHPLIRPIITLFLLFGLVSSALLAFAPQPAHAQTSLSVTPRAALAGEEVTLTSSGYTPGGYDGTIRWDGTDVETFAIPSGGAFSVAFTVPEDATTGDHTITVCAGTPCFTGEFEQTASVDLFVGVRTFDLTISLEWEPGANDSLANGSIPADCPAPTATFLADLEAGLRETAAYLYSFTEGQMTLGEVAVYTGGENWQEADIRILANSGYRPTAFVGGIVDTPTLVTTGVAERPVLYYPAAVLLGRLWDGNGARCGAWSDPAGWRTIGHEFGHYALFLYDQYFNLETGAEQYCTTTGLSGPPFDTTPAPNGSADTLMAYHYTADKLLQEGAMPLEDLEGARLSCADTPQAYVHGLSEWQTIKRFYPAITIPTAARTDWDFGTIEAAGLFNVTFATTPPASDTSAAIRLEALPEVAERPVYGDAYLVELDNSADPERIIGQGWVVPGEENPPSFWGAVPGRNNQAAVFVHDETTGERFVTPPTSTEETALDPANTTALSVAADQWRPSITITPNVLEQGASAEIVDLEVRLEDCGRTTQVVEVAYCPAGGTCSDMIDMQQERDGTFVHTFRFPVDGQQEPPATHGYIYARRDSTNAEAIVWYQLGGGVGPGIANGHAPLADGLVNTDVPPATPSDSRDTRVLFSPSPACTAGAPLPDNVLSILGTAFNLQPVTAGPNESIGWGAGDPPLRVRLSYNQDLLDRLGVDETQLVIVRLDAQGVWQVVPTSAQSQALDWIAAEPQVFDGDGSFYALAIGAVSQDQPQLFLPLLGR